MKKAHDITLTALFAVIIAICGYISLPVFTIPLTLQTFAVSLSGFFLGKRRGVLAALLYLAMGAVGLPVFSSMRGGFSVLLSPTGGFLIGFAALAFLCGCGKTEKQRFMFALCGLILCHLIGCIHFSAVSGTGLAAAFFSVSLPFILKDVLSVFGALLLSKRLKKELKL